MLLSDAVLGTLKWGTTKDSNCHFAVEDADWATSDKPVVLGNDGCVRVFDTELRTCHSVLNVLEMGGGWREGRGEPRFQGPLASLVAWGKMGKRKKFDARWGRG